MPSVILKYKGNDVADLGPADLYMMESTFQDEGYIDNAADSLMAYIENRLIALAAASPNHNELYDITNEVTDMLADFMASCQSYGRMYMLASILGNKDFEVEVE